MYKSSLLVLAATFGITGCDGGACPAIAIPVYNIIVYDSVSGDLLCQYHWGGEDHECEITITYPENDRSMADISVSLDGYASQTKNDIANLSERYRCFDQPSYTTEVEFFLTTE